ncbi:MAG TPA: DUF454 domain-containing protein [Bdellovibrionales bacterium]|nr:hypothetical protein [Pseudobdellovibrionaceae bacterium]HAG91211.1 DUF454 domain-containing protein [Bdellovibrionales bacterium]
MIGAFLPILPTTPFILLAAWCFIKSSSKSYNWLQNHHWLGPPLKRWEKRGAISKLSKFVAISMITLSLALIWSKEIPTLIQLLATFCLVGATTFILTRPHS